LWYKKVNWSIPPGTNNSFFIGTTEFDETWYFSFFRKSVEKIQVSLKSDKSNGYFTWRSFHI
jgi:hypothetical protein